MVAYYGSRDWTDELGDGTRKKRRQLLEKLRAEFGDAPPGLDHWDATISTADGAAFAERATQLGFGAARADEVLHLWRADQDRPDARGEEGKAGAQRWAHCLDRGRCCDIPPNVSARLARTHGLGSKSCARPWLASQTDAARLGPSDIKLVNGQHWLIDFEPQKTARTSGVKISVPLHPDLVAAIAAMTVVSTRTFMVGEARGRESGRSRPARVLAPGCARPTTPPGCRILPATACANRDPAGILGRERPGTDEDFWLDHVCAGANLCRSGGSDEDGRPGDGSVAGVPKREQSFWTPKPSSGEKGKE